MSMCAAGAPIVGAFFDMDHTLLSDSSVTLLVHYMRERGELSVRQLAHIMSLTVRHKVGHLDMVETTRAFVRDLAGQSEADQIAMSKNWFQEQLIHYVAEEGRRWVAGHRRLGHRVALITASPTYTASVLADHLGIPADDVLATRFEVRNGLFTGRLVEPMVFGQGKLRAAQVYAARHGLELSRSYFYTDSIVDLPLLERVGFPVAVNPDRPLRKLAERLGWRIVCFY